MTHVAVLASRVRAEEKDLLAALTARGAQVTHVHSGRWWAGAGAGAIDVDVVLNREISWTRSRYLARTLEAQGVPVLNPSGAVETCGDKWLTALALRRAGIPTPDTALALTPEAGMAAASAIGGPVVVKPLVSSWGRRVGLLRDPDAVQAVLEQCAAQPSPQARAVCVQRYVPAERDLRVVVVGGEVLGAAYRTGDGWRHNVALGGRTTPCEPDDVITKLALAAAEATGAVIAGVDLLETPDGPVVLEVNHNVEFAGLRRAVPGADVAGALADLALRTAGRSMS